jgi:hypothetical protein
MASLPLLVIKIVSIMPAVMDSFTTFSIIGRSYIGKSFIGMALVAGSILVPSPATGIIALVSFYIIL